MGEIILPYESKLCVGRGVNLSNLFMHPFMMVATMDTTIPPKLVIAHMEIKTYNNVSLNGMIVKIIL
jgi:hypothetical protein